MNRELNRRLNELWDKQREKKVARVRKVVHDAKEQEEEHRAKKYIDEIRDALGFK